MSSDNEDGSPTVEPGSYRRKVIALRAAALRFDKAEKRGRCSTRQRGLSKAEKKRRRAG